MKYSLLKRLWWAAYSRHPRIVPYKGARDHGRSDEWDRKDNDETALPITEGLNVICIWASELFGPTEIESLYRGLDRLGWASGGMTRRRCVDWIRQQRKSGGGGWLNIGIIHSTDYEGHNIDRLSADLPDGVTYLLAYIHQICPSVTCLQLAFVLDEHMHGIFAQELMTPRTSYSEPDREHLGVHRIPGPTHIKEASIAERRKELRQMATTWIRKYFPGLFIGTFEMHPPTAELTTTRNIPVLGRLSGEAHQSWRHVISGYGHQELWKFQKQDTFLVTTPEQEDTGSSHTQISICTERLPPEALAHYGSKDHTAQIAYVHGIVDGVLARFAVLSLMLLFRASLMEMRDQLRLVALHKLRTKKLLHYVQHFYSRTVHVPSIAQEVEHSTAPPFRYKHECEGFVEAEPFPNQPAGILGDRLADHVNHLAKQLLVDDRTTRETLKQIFEVVAARENIKTQRRMEIVAGVAALLAALTLWISLPACNRWPQWLHDYAEPLCRLRGYDVTNTP